MMLFFWWFFWGVMGGYGVVLLWLAYKAGQQRNLQQRWNPPLALPKLSVVIAFRNEAQNLPFLLADLSQLEYPKEALEIIFVDDHSQDDGLGLVAEWAAHYAPEIVKLGSLPAHLSGKKEAMAHGVGKATSDWLLFTDADCRLPPKWARQMVASQQQTQAAMICGPVHLVPQTGGQIFEALEFSSLIAVAASSLALGKPSLCNAANLMVRTSAYHKAAQTRTDSHLPSGDDVFLMHHLSHHNEKIAFCYARSASVGTKPHSSWKSFENQRIRWAGKWKSGVSGANKGLAVLVWFFHLLVLVGVSCFFRMQAWSALLILLAAKATVETIFLQRFMVPPGFVNHCRAVWLMQLPYSLYVVYFGIKILLSSHYEWKNRRLPL